MPNVNISVNTGFSGAGGSLNIRGQGSINSNSPLILIDGVRAIGIRSILTMLNRFQL